MINLDLNREKVVVLYALEKTFPVKIGDVVLIQKEHQVNHISSKPPWKKLLIGEWKYQSGTLYNCNLNIHNQHIKFCTDNININDVSEIQDSDICDMALLQDVNGNIYSKIHIIRGCSLAGVENNSSNINIDFKVQKSEIILSI